MMQAAFKVTRWIGAALVGVLLLCGQGASWAAAPYVARSEVELLPGGRTLSLDVGWMNVYYGGETVPRLTLNATPDDEWHAHAKYLGFRVIYDQPMLDFDWRLRLSGGMPGFAAAAATIGVRKNLSPDPSFRLLARAGAGLEAMIGWAGPGSSLVPLLLAEGELAALFNIGSDSFSLGPVLDLSLRYGLPLGVGVGAGLFIRAEGRW